VRLRPYQPIRYLVGSTLLNPSPHLNLYHNMNEYLINLIIQLPWAKERLSDLFRDAPHAQVEPETHLAGTKHNNVTTEKKNDRKTVKTLIGGRSPPEQHHSDLKGGIAETSSCPDSPVLFG
jgi:hypothetical protein